MSVSARVPFNRPALLGREEAYLREVLAGVDFAGDGPFTARVEAHVSQMLGGPRVLLTHSCTAALEIAALLTVSAGDEVILPSFTFPTTASAFIRAGARPVFADIRPDSLTLDPGSAEAAVTPRTRAIVTVHYAGVGRDLDRLAAIARPANALLIEDAAHAFGASSGGRPLGTFGQLAAFSFHQTKNVMAGEGGALVINEPSLVRRAEIIRDHGTDRARFVRGEVGAYSWQEPGSAFAPAEIVAAFLLAQVEESVAITAQRLRQWSRYHAGFAPVAAEGLVRRPHVPEEAAHNGHIYYLLAADTAQRDTALAALAAEGIAGATHYVPLHQSPAGRAYGTARGGLPVTEDVARRLLRLPLHAGLAAADIDRIVAIVSHTLRA